MRAHIHKAPSLVRPCLYVDQPTRTQGPINMQLRLLLSRALGMYVEITSALDGPVGSRVTCSGTSWVLSEQVWTSRTWPPTSGSTPPAHHSMWTRLLPRTFHNTVSDVKQAWWLKIR